MSKRTARTLYGLISIPSAVLIISLFALRLKWWGLGIGIVVAAVSTAVGWVVFDGSYALGDNGDIIDRRPRTPGLEERAMKAYEQSPNAETAEQLRRTVNR